MDHDKLTEICKSISPTMSVAAAIIYSTDILAYKLDALIDGVKELTKETVNLRWYCNYYK